MTQRITLKSVFCPLPRTGLPWGGSLLALVLIAILSLAVTAPRPVLAQDDDEYEEEMLDEDGNPIPQQKEDPAYVVPYVAVGCFLVLGTYAVCMTSKRKYAFETGDYERKNLLEMDAEEKAERAKKEGEPKKKRRGAGRGKRR